MSQEIYAAVSAAIGALGLLISAATLYVIIIYTRETMKMRLAASSQARELTRQIRLSIMPAFTVAFVARNDLALHSFPPKEPLYYLELQNVGNGLASDIRIEPLVVRHDPSMSVEKFPDGELVFRWVPSLRPSASERLDSVPSFKRPGDFADLMHWMQLYGAAGKVFRLVLRFRDIEGSEYTQTLDLSRSDCTPSPVRALGQSGGEALAA
jgi:hypothetical protein